jgi:DNA-binding response OmpR family regulator
VVPIRILLAIPEEALLASYQQVLFQEGFEVAVATSGLDCLVGLRRLRPDVLVLGEQLLWGGVSGVLALIQEGADVPPVPVLLLSPPKDTRDGDRVTALPRGAIFLNSPSPHQLVRGIRHQLKGDRFPVPGQEGPSC